jgi:peptidoglycan/xylan/chitin deacetylase (PgdA/CDA1 family)
MQRDTGLYRYAPYRGRPKISWPDGARVAFWVAPNIEHYEWQPPTNPTRKPWPRHEPDVLNYSHRDYGNRVGFDRLADTMERYGVRGSVSLSVAVCDHYPSIIERCNEMGWELFSHGVYNTRYFYNMSEDEQRHVIRDSIETLKTKAGQQLDGWLTPSITPTLETQHLLAEEGIKYTLDYFHDDQPMPLNVRSGKLISLPYSIEVNDIPMIMWRHISPREYVEIQKAHFDRLYAEGENNGTVMCMPIHPYVLGQPSRIGAFAEVLEYVTSHDKVWLATAREIADWYTTHHYDEVQHWLGTLPGEH